jgi:hypothetical protein
MTRTPLRPLFALLSLATLAGCVVAPAHPYYGGSGYYARPSYVAPEPVYVAPAPVYVSPQPTVILRLGGGGGGGSYHDDHHDHDRGPPHGGDHDHHDDHGDGHRQDGQH